MALKYQRILLKISGEALGGEKGMGFDEPTMDAICGGVKKAHDLGVQIGIVVGGGNFWRGRSSGKMERTLADKIGMLATVMNALAVSDKLEQLGVPTEVFTSITMPQVAQPFTRKDALRAMDEGKIAVFGGGTGNPFFSTDTATALRAVEVSADVMFKATMWMAFTIRIPTSTPTQRSMIPSPLPRCWKTSWLLWMALLPLCAATTSCPSSCSIWPTRTTLPVPCRARMWAHWFTRAETPAADIHYRADALQRSPKIKRNRRLPQ